LSNHLLTRNAWTKETPRPKKKLKEMILKGADTCRKMFVLRDEVDIMHYEAFIWEIFRSFLVSHD